MSLSLEEREALELRANEQRRRVTGLIEALDARRHPRVSQPEAIVTKPPVMVALVGVGVASVVASSQLKGAPKWVLRVLGAVVGAAGAAVGARGVRRMAGTQPTSLAAVNPVSTVPPLREVSFERPLPLGLPHSTVPHAKRKARGNGWLIALLVVLLLGLGLRIGLNPLAAHFTQRGLDEGLTGYSGSFSTVRVSIFPLSYSITDLRLVQDGMEPKDAILYVKRLDANAKWGNLIRGRIFATAKLDHAHFRMLYGQAEAPPEVEKAAEQGAEAVKRADLDVASLLNDIVPFRLDRLELKDSEVTLIDATDPKRPHFWVNDIEFVAENIVSRERLDQGAPLMVTGRATVEKTGVLKMLFVADLLDEKPGFTGQAQLSGLDLESLYAWASAKAGVSPHGKLDVFVNVSSAKGGIKGDVKVMATDVKMDGLETVGDKLKALAGNIAFKVLADREEKRTVATTLPLRGALTSPVPQIYPTILGVVRNAFVDAINWGFSTLPVDTSQKKEGIITQTVKGLDKKKEGPEAQPEGGK